MNVVDRCLGWIMHCGLGTRIERFADLVGVTMERSTGLMLERATVQCQVESEQFQHRG